MRRKKTRRNERSQQPVAQTSPARQRFLKKSFSIVGVGASAGGLEAFKQFLSALSMDTGMAFVLVQHLDPRHDSMSADILSRVTRMPVIEVKDGMRAEPNHVYVIPPNFSMGIQGGVLKLLPRLEARGAQTVIDSFFRSLAEDQRHLAIGVILSGNGADGTEGLTAIQGEGGITFAQSPRSAKFEDMPKSAIASGAVNLALIPEDIAKELARVARHQLALPIGSPAEGEVDPEKPLLDDLSKIFLLLRNSCHVDFTFYKSNTIQRRLERRMILRRLDSLGAYAKFLAKDPDEVKALFADILIHVTSFFRDPDAFEALSREVFPKLSKERPPGLPIRVWVPACSTGEEVYSIAMSLVEFLGDRAAGTPIQIFASDISESAIQKARVGEYPESISRDVSPERLNRFFTKTEGGCYKVSKSIRDLCLFSRHDVTVDPPFAKIDLISCRNLLIYFTAALQKSVIPIFHYALCPKGFLWVGRSETIGSFSNLFSLIDKPNKIYTRKNAPIALSLQFPSSTYVPGKQEAVRKAPSFAKPGMDAQKLADLALQSEYPGVLVNDEMDILQFRGRTAPFIEPAAGAAGYHLLKMARPDFVPDLRALIQAAKRQNATARKEGLRFRDGRRVVTFNLKVIPVKPSSACKERYYYVLFEDGAVADAPKSKKSLKGKRSGRGSQSPTGSRFLELQEELGGMRPPKKT
jgi:two-component system CheB/CheR fusion protein